MPGGPYRPGMHRGVCWAASDHTNPSRRPVELHRGSMAVSDRSTAVAGPGLGNRASYMRSSPVQVSAHVESAFWRRQEHRSASSPASAASAPSRCPLNVRRRLVRTAPQI
jgi:hypothetical protein